MRAGTAAVVLACAIALTGCGSDEPTTDSLGDEPVVTEEPTPGPVLGPYLGCAGAPRPAAAPPGSTTDLGKKPVVPKGPASVTGLQVADVVVGKGKEACTGAEVAMKYVGVLADGGKPFDASWDRGPNEVFELTLGNGDVIAGWDEGIVGMRAGGRRQLTIPSDLAYGPQGRPPEIPGGATLVFVVDLVTVA
jgi:hypothetical protein